MYKSESVTGDGTYMWGFKVEEKLEVISIKNDSTFTLLCTITGTKTTYTFSQADGAKKFNNTEYK